MSNLRKSKSCNSVVDNRFQAPDNEYIAPRTTTAAIEEELSQILDDYSFFTNTDEDDIEDNKIIEVWRNIPDNAAACQLLDELSNVDDNYIQRQINAIRRTDSLQLLTQKALRVF